jgi:hypothetical protein
MNKKISSIAILMCLLLPILAAAMQSASATPTTLSLLYNGAATATGPSVNVDINKVITVKVHVDNVANLFQWSVGVTWDKTVVDLTSVSEDTTWFKAAAQANGDSTLWYATAINHAAGTMQEFGAAIQGTSAASTTTGADVATLTFKIIGYSATGSAIQLTSTTHAAPELLGPAPNHDVISSVAAPLTVVMTPPAPHGPLAAFTMNATFAHVGDHIHLDSSSSAPGFDGFNNVAIDGTFWTLGGAYTGSQPTGTTADITVGSAGTVTVSLRVTAGSTGSNTAPSQTITVVAIPTGANLDVYTDRGVGMINSDPYAPQELVTVYGAVTYNNVPVVNKLVTFQVYDNSSNTVAIVQGTSDTNGIATATFRMPTPDVNGSLGFWGTWTIVGTVDVSQVVKTDTVTFTCAWLVTQASLSPDSPVVRGIVAHANFTLVNTRSVPMPVYYSVTWYDECGVALGCDKFNVVLSGHQSLPVTLQKTIPTYSYVGTGKIFADVMTQFPAMGGVAYCPENTAVIVINAH